VNDEGSGRTNGFYDLVNKGKINLIAPARVVSFGTDRKSIVLNDGRIVKADAVVLATGFRSSWNGIFDRTLTVPIMCRFVDSSLINRGHKRRPRARELCSSEGRRTNGLRMELYQPPEPPTSPPRQSTVQFVSVSRPSARKEHSAKGLRCQWILGRHSCCIILHIVDIMIQPVHHEHWIRI
jgi:hypothetical protein